MQEVNAPFAEVAKVLPFVKRTAASLHGAAESAEMDADTLFRPRIVDRLTKPAVLAPAAALEHDARNALFLLRMLVSLISEPDVLNTSYKQAGSDLRHVAGLLDILVEQLIACRPDHATAHDASKTMREVRPSAKEPQGADEALKGCTRLLQTIAGAHVQVYVSAQTSLPPLALSEDELLRVLSNLVSNASEAMPAGGAIRITARRALSSKAPAVMLHVSDDGPGIPRMALGRVFEPGFTSKQLGRNRTSLGLGLAIVRDLLEKAGGKVEVASTRGRGTTFELCVPCRKAAQRKQPSPRHTSVTGAKWSETLE